MSAQLVQASAQAFLSFGTDKGKGKGKAKGKGKGRHLVRPSHLSLEDRRRLVLVVERDIGQMIGRASSSSSTQNQTRTARTATRQHLTSQAIQGGVCFVLNEYSDDPDTSANMVGQNDLCRQKRPNRYP